MGHDGGDGGFIDFFGGSLVVFGDGGF